MDVTYRFDNRPVIAAGTLYWDILRLFSELKLGLQASLKKYPDIVSMALDTWGCDFGFIDRNGKLLGNPVTYRDKPRHDRSALLYKTLPRRELFQLCAGSTIEIMGLYQLFSYKCDNAPEMREGHRLLMIPDMLNYLLTGAACQRVHGRHHGPGLQPGSTGPGRSASWPAWASPTRSSGRSSCPAT